MVYNTFDWGIRDADGYYFILGRTDDVINVAGHRLGTREIEESISSHPNVAEVAVVGVADAVKGQVAMAFVIAKDASALGEQAARLQLEGDIMKTVDRQLGAVARPVPGPLRQRPAEDAFRQAAAPRDAGRLRGPRSRRPDDDRGSGGAAGAARRGGPRMNLGASSRPGCGKSHSDSPIGLLKRTLAALLIGATCLSAAAQSLPRIEKAADLPRFSYRVDGQVEDLLRSPERFAPFAAAVRRDIEATLSATTSPIGRPAAGCSTRSRCSTSWPVTTRARWHVSRRCAGCRTSLPTSCCRVRG